jgi:hypothetical protein
MFGNLKSSIFINRALAMGYTLKIGERDVDLTEDGDRIIIRDEEFSYAPAFGEPTDYTNARWPSYTGWGNFCRNIGIEGIMFNTRNGGSDIFELPDGSFVGCLMPEHPGVARITQKHFDYIKAKVDTYKALHPTHRAEFPQESIGDSFSPDPECDGNLCRAEWLLFWMEWAILNCENPTFYNS